MLYFFVVLLVSLLAACLAPLGTLPTQCYYVLQTSTDSSRSTGEGEGGNCSKQQETSSGWYCSWKPFGYSLAIENFSLAVPLIEAKLPVCDQVPLSSSPFLSFVIYRLPRAAPETKFFSFCSTQKNYYSPLPFRTSLQPFFLYSESYVRVLP